MTCINVKIELNTRMCCFSLSFIIFHYHTHLIELNAINSNNSNKSNNSNNSNPSSIDGPNFEPQACTHQLNRRRI